MSLCLGLTLTAPAWAAKGDVDLVSRATGPAGAKGDGYSYEPAISADGSVVAFNSQATNRATGVAGANADDGRVVAFMSQSDNLDPGDDGRKDQHVYVRDLDADTTTLVSRADGAAGASANRYSSEPVLSADGRLVAFESEGSNLHPDDGDGRYDVFVRDVEANTTTLVSRDESGTKGNNYFYHPAMSPDGRYVAFASAATNLHPDDGDGELDVFRRDALGAPSVAATPAAPATNTDAAPEAGAALLVEPPIARLPSPRAVCVARRRGACASR